MSQRRTDSARAIDDELVPLSVAAQVAYFHLADARLHPQAADELAEVVSLAAIALSQVAPVYPPEGDGARRPLAEGEVEEKLFRPVRERTPAPLERFFIRRGDLRRAIVTLAEAKRSFAGRRHG